MDPIAAQMRTRMLGWSKAKGCIRVGAAPGKDRSTIDDEITSTNKPTTQSGEDGENKQSFWQRRSGLAPTFALLRRGRDAGTTIFAQR